MKNYIDTHIHLDSKEYENDLDAVIKGALNKDVKYFINPGSDLRSLDIIPRLCEQYSQILPAYGIHPHDAKDFNDEIYQKIKSLLKQGAVAVGETGLDFHYNFSPAATQKEVFIKHIYLAKEFNLPLIIHSRKAEEEVYNILKKVGNGHPSTSPSARSGRSSGQVARSLQKGVIHCYSGSLDYARRFIDLGFYIGITGVVTFPKAENIREIVKNIPVDRILSETDGPYMAPVPYRGKRNLPEYIPVIVENINEIVWVIPKGCLKGQAPHFDKLSAKPDPTGAGQPFVGAQDFVPVRAQDFVPLQNQLFENAKRLFGF